MQADELKEAANDLCKQKKFEEAVCVYTKAIQLNPTPIYYRNRSVANLKLRRFDCALEDATTSVRIDKTYSNGYISKADSHKALKQYTLAVEDYERAKKIDPNNTQLSVLITKCKERLQQNGNIFQNNLSILVVQYKIYISYLNYFLLSSKNLHHDF